MTIVVVRKAEPLPRGAFCVHPRMRVVRCGSTICVRPCRVECPDCGLSWMFDEGVLG